MLVPAALNPLITRQWVTLDGVNDHFFSQFVLFQHTGVSLGPKVQRIFKCNDSCSLGVRRISLTERSEQGDVFPHEQIHVSWDALSTG